MELEEIKKALEELEKIMRESPGCLSFRYYKTNKEIYDLIEKCGELYHSCVPWYNQSCQLGD